MQSILSVFLRSPGSLPDCMARSLQCLQRGVQVRSRVHFETELTFALSASKLFATLCTHSKRFEL
eukprot:4459072-Pleurochrysis_carterae.AAC.1